MDNKYNESYKVGAITGGMRNSLEITYKLLSEGMISEDEVRVMEGYVAYQLRNISIEYVNKVLNRVMDMAERHGRMENLHNAIRETCQTDGAIRWAIMPPPDIFFKSPDEIKEYVSKCRTMN